jgi:DNA-binding NarL/FixJ family response regulator
MIIDGQAAFRSLLMHHVSTHWPDAIITDFDPIAGGHLPEEFSGAGNDIILLGNELGDRQGVDIVKSFKKKPNFPAVVYFGRKDEAGPVLDRGADGFFLRNEFSHDALIVRLSDILVARRRVSSTGSLFVGDKSAGIEPLIKGAAPDSGRERRKYRRVRPFPAGIRDDRRNRSSQYREDL